MVSFDSQFLLERGINISKLTVKFLGLKNAAFLFYFIYFNTEIWYICMPKLACLKVDSSKLKLLQLVNLSNSLLLGESPYIVSVTNIDTKLSVENVTGQFDKLDEGLYIVNITDKNGCEYIKPENVTVKKSQGMYMPKHNPLNLNCQLCNK